MGQYRGIYSVILFNNRTPKETRVHKPKYDIQDNIVFFEKILFFFLNSKKVVLYYRCRKNLNFINRKERRICQLITMLKQEEKKK